MGLYQVMGCLKLLDVIALSGEKNPVLGRLVNPALTLMKLICGCRSERGFNILDRTICADMKTRDWFGGRREPKRDSATQRLR